MRSFDEIDRVVGARRCTCGRPLRSTGEGARQVGGRRFRFARLACDDCEEEHLIFFDVSEVWCTERCRSPTPTSRACCARSRSSSRWRTCRSSRARTRRRRTRSTRCDDPVPRAAGERRGEGAGGRSRGRQEHRREDRRAADDRQDRRTTRSCTRETPVDVTALTGVEGVGPKTSRTLYQALGVTDLASLEAAARAGRIRDAAALRREERAEDPPRPRASPEAASRPRAARRRAAARAARSRRASRRCPASQRATIAGSIRRRRETVGDADILVVARRAGAGHGTSSPRCPRSRASWRRATPRSRSSLASGLQIDVRVVPRASFGAALHYFTGSKAHNVVLRQIAIKKGLKLNEYGVFRGETAIAGAHRGGRLRRARPALHPARAARGSPARSRRRAPGACRISSSTARCAATCRRRPRGPTAPTRSRRWSPRHARLGLSYIAITDHTRDLAMTSAPTRRSCASRAKAIDALNARLDGFRVLKGAEVNIRKDGTLDIADETLAELDVVGVADPLALQPVARRDDARVLRAMQNPHADILFHPTGAHPRQARAGRPRHRRGDRVRARDRHRARARRLPEPPRSEGRARAQGDRRPASSSSSTPTRTRRRTSPIRRTTASTRRAAAGRPATTCSTRARWGRSSAP